MAGGNYIKLNRKLLDWEWIEEPNTFVVWIYILLRANWEDRRVKGRVIPRGSFLTTYAEIGSKLNLSARQVRTAIQHLETTHEVSHTKSLNRMLITVEKYEEYQACNVDEVTQQVTQQVRRKSHGSHTDVTQNKNMKNKKNLNIYMTSSYSSNYESICESFNSICSTLPPVQKLTDKRRNKLKARLRTFTEKDFLDCFRKVNESDFLSGRNGKWQNCSFDWIIDSDEHMQRILEGNYRNREPVQTDSFQDAWRRLDEKERSL